MPKGRSTKTKISSPLETKFNLKPLMGYILVEPEKALTQTASGLYLPESAQERPAQGTVIAVGEDLIDNGRVYSCPVKIGDKVIYKKWGGDEIKLGGKELKIVKFDDLMAVLE